MGLKLNNLVIFLIKNFKRGNWLFNLKFYYG
jgi:hypothetical protein